MKILKPLFPVIWMLLAWMPCNAQEVTNEYLPNGWEFTRIIRPSKSDAAQNARITFNGNKPISSCLSPDGLHNGIMPQECRLLRDFFCFTDDNADGGKIVMDLGRVISVAMVNSYSAHGPVGGTTWCEEFGGERGPQVYTLYGSSSDHPDPDNLNTAQWTKIAHVDIRPDDGEANWQGSYGVNIKGENGAPLGRFRWLVWDTKPTLKPGVNPNWTKTWFAELDVHTAESLASAGDAIPAGTQLKEIIVAYKTHFDIGFTHAAPEIVDIYRTSMIDEALDIVDQSAALPPEKRFSWTIPSWVAYQILWDGQDPVRRKRVTEAIRNGSIVVHGLPITVHTESMTLEDLVFGLSLNKTISQEVGIPMSRSGKLTDIPSHSWIWPTIFKNAGMDFLQIGTNPTNERPSVPLLYYWEGPDGSRLLTMHPQGYGSNTEFGHGLYPPADWPYKHWLAMLVTSDNNGPPKIEDINRLLAEAERNLPGVKIRFGKMEDFADAIYEEEKEGATVPVVRADLPDTWIHGVGSMPVENAIARKTRADMTSAGSLNTHLNAWGVAAGDITADLFTARERSVMYGEHTYGGNRNLQGRNAYTMENFEEYIRTDERCQWLTQTWQDHADYILTAQRITDSLNSEMINRLAQSVAVEGERIVVYNPLPYRRHAIIDLPGEDGEQFLAEHLPPSGYNTYELAEIRKRKTIRRNEPSMRETLQNEYLKVEIDIDRGGIVSIIDKEEARELVDPNAPYAFGQYFYQRFDSAQNRQYHLDCNHLNTVYQSNGRACFGWNTRADLPGSPEYQCAVPKYDEMRVRTTAVGTEVILTAKPQNMIRSKVTTTITLPYDSPWLEIEVRLDDKKPDYWPEAGSIYLPVNAPKPQFWIGRIGGIVEPTDFARRSNRTYGCVSTGAMIIDTLERGVAICPLDHTLMSFGEKGLCTIDPEYVPETPLALVNMYNTLWTINFPYWIEGSVSSRVRVWGTGDLNKELLLTPAAEMLTPVLVGYADGTAGKLPETATGLTLSRSGIEVTSFTDNPDGEGYTLRLWESLGSSREVTVTLPKGMRASKATPVNLRGEKIGSAVPIRSENFTFFIKGHAPATFVIN